MSVANLNSAAGSDAAALPHPGPGTARVDRSQPFDPAELLARVWEQSLPLMRDRVAFLETTALQAQAGTLTNPDRTEAFHIAHKLAGALGMFGYPRGTEIAQQLETLLTGDDPLDSPALTRLAADLRASVTL